MASWWRRVLKAAESSGPKLPRGTYTDWFWPGTGYRRLEHDLVIHRDPGERTHYFWSHQFRTERGEGGYFGLQTYGNRVDGSLGKMAIFSFWNTRRADGPAYQRFGGEGEGMSCRIPFFWEVGRPYRLAVEAVGEDGGDTAWAASVDGEEFGRIWAPSAWGGLGAWSVVWTEYYGGPLGRCADLPYSDVTFGRPYADRSVRPSSSGHHLGDGHCGGSTVDDTGDGARHQMGKPEGDG